jgi:putative restriction endonuclease
MDDLIRTAAFEWLEEQTNVFGEVLPRTILETGFEFKGQRITLLGPSGIWKPKVMELPLSITTTSNGPYNDSFTPDNFLKYSYRGSDPYHRDNAGLRELWKTNQPLIYFHSIIKGKYLATWPVYIINDSITDLTFTVAVDNLYNILSDYSQVEDKEAAYYRRSYLTSNVRIRLHQQSFRERVLLAYQGQCTLCRLKHTELLDAAHIIGDKDDLGDPIVQNGLALCKIHHAAFDKNIIGINPDYKIKIRQDILDETDGPMLRYGIQSLENSKIILPRHQKDWPDKERLERRFITFLKAV